MKTLLTEGKIPPHTECLYKAECNDGVTGLCAHHGKAHGVPFSCGAARAFDLVQRRECQCNLRTKLVGDGCEVCNPEYAAGMRPNV